MVEEVARNASVVAQNTAAAKKSASDAVPIFASEAATHATDAAGSARAASTSAEQAASPAAQSASSSAGTASTTKATEVSKALPLQSPQKRGGHQCRCRENVRNECGSVTTISSHFCIHCDDEKRQKPPLQPEMRLPPKRRKQNHQKRTPNKRQQCSLGNGGRKFREGGKTSETNAKSSETAANRAPQLRQVLRQ